MSWSDSEALRCLPACFAAISRRRASSRALLASAALDDLGEATVAEATPRFGCAPPFDLTGPMKEIQNEQMTIII